MAGLLHNMAFVSMPGGGEWVVILVIGLLIFGRRLPEVARNLGKSVNEFKKGIREFQDSADEVARDMNKVTSDVASDVKKATGVDDYGYEEPNDGNDPTSTYESPDSATETDSHDVSEPAETTSDVVEPTTPETQESSTEQDESDPYVEPMR